MLARVRTKLSYANVVSTLALCLVIGGGSAYAVTQLDKNSVKSKHIVNGEVKSADLGRPEAPHVVGTAGEPAFSDGGQGDCEWISLEDAPDFSGYDPVSFFKDGFGIVHLSGIAGALDGSGGDGLCKSFGPGGQLEDGIPFTLPPGYRPTGLQTHETQDTLFWITPAEGAEVEGVELPGSVIMQRDSGFVDLDGITYRAAP